MKLMMNYKKPAFWIIISAVIIAIVIVVCFLTNSIGFKFDEANNTIISANYFDTRNADDTIIIKMTPAQIDELSSQLAVIKNTGSDDKYAELTPKCQISTLLQDGTYIRIYGYSFSDNAMVDIEWSGKRYVVSDGGFQKYLSGIYAMEDTAAATSVLRDGGLVPGTTYVSYQCLYMNPLSSYSAMGGDSGCKYIVGEDCFYTINRDDDSSVKVFEVSSWEWQEFPYTDEEWLGLYLPQGFGEISNISELYDEMLYLPITAGKFLLKMDGSLWLVELRHNQRGDTYLWSIYNLVPESVMGAAHWEYAPTSDSRYPYFRFEFDMEYTDIVAVCIKSPLVDFDAPGTPSDAGLTFREGNALYWSPIDEEGNAVASAIIHFTVRKDGAPLYNGTIYIEDNDDSDGCRIYNAAIIGADLRLSQNTERTGGIISSID